MPRFTKIIKQELGDPMDFRAAKRIVDAAIGTCQAAEIRPLGTYYPYDDLRITFGRSQKDYKLVDEICVSGETTVSSKVASVKPGTDVSVGLITTVRTYDESVVIQSALRLLEAVRYQNAIPR